MQTLQLRYVALAFVVVSQVFFMMRSSLLAVPQCDLGFDQGQGAGDHSFNPLDNDGDGGDGGESTRPGDEGDGGPDHTHDDGGVHVRDRGGGDDVYLTVIAIPKPVRVCVCVCVAVFGDSHRGQI